MRRALLLLACCLASAAQAAEWTRLTRIPGEDQYFYDRSKLVIQGEEITYWKKVVFKRPQPMKNQLAAWVLMRERIHCTDHTLRLISYLYYTADGSTIDYVADHEKEGTPIIPDTLGDAFERQLCELVKAQQEAEKIEADKRAAEKAEAKKAAAAKETPAPGPTPSAAQPKAEPQPETPAPPMPQGTEPHK
jgi:hypothetical protein